MKTEIIYSYKVEDGFSLSQVIPLSKKNCVLIKYIFPDVSIVETIGEVNKKFVISDIEGMDNSWLNATTLFKFNESFGVVDSSENLLIWQNVFDNPVIIKIKNSYYQNRTNEHIKTTHIGDYDKKENSIYFGVSDTSCHGYKARYWSKLEIQDKRFFFFKSKELRARWHKLNQLNLKNYPLTEKRRLGFPGEEWLNICNIMKKDERVFIHTNGGAVTRLKSGPNHEFSIITVLTNKNKFLKNYHIEEGNGFFASTKDYLIIHPAKNRKKLLFYNTNNFQIDFEISLTPKQNLGKAKSYYLKADYDGENLYIYNASFFNICKIIS